MGEGQDKSSDAAGQPAGTAAPVFISYASQDTATANQINFGLAWLAQARVSLFSTSNGLLPPQDGYESARQQAQQALRLSPDLGGAHDVLANIHRNYDWDWAASGAEVRLALASDSTNPMALMRAGQLAYTLGRWDDAERDLRLALVRDPLLAVATFSLGIAQYGAGQFADSEVTFRRVLDLAPDYILAHSYLGKVLLAQGKPESALVMLEQDNENARAALLPIALQAAGRKNHSDEALKILITKLAGTHAYFVAMTYAYRGDRDLALQWLERAYEQRDQWLKEIVSERLLKNMESDPRYKTFLKKMKLPER